MWLVPAVEKSPRTQKFLIGDRIGPPLALLFAWESPDVAHRDRRRFDGQPSLSGHCGHGPIFAGSIQQIKTARFCDSAERMPFAPDNRISR
jgi:hypothetical protein